MLVVIPVCEKDQHLVLKNLEWVHELDGRIDAHCDVITHGHFMGGRDVCNEVLRAFTSVDFKCYDEWGGDPKWPHPQNWAWQSAARLLSKQQFPWIWWEADSVPVKRGWYEALKKEYEAGGKPFMGYITSLNGSEPHMAGVGVYPHNTPNYSVNAMLCRAAPFDVVIYKDIEQHVHKANHLIQHHVKENGDSTHFHDHASVKSIIDPGVVLFHRCKDGSLIDRLRNPQSVSSIVAKWFPKQKKKREKSWPSILKQTKWKAGFFDLPSTDRECHFNSALVDDKDNTLWLVSRRWRRNPPLTWTSDLIRHRLSEGMEIKESHPIILPKQLGHMEQHEDPRIIRRKDGFLLGYCSWLLGGNYQAHQALANLDSGWNCMSTFHLVYGNNGSYPGGGIGHEKNWTWFFHENSLHLDYQFSPHVVLRVMGEKSVTEHRTDTPLAANWKYGHIRGGTPPVRVGDEYISFFHSSQKWTEKQNRYFMGAYAFEARAPFAVTRMTPEPLLSGSEYDPRTLGGPLCVFPCGSILQDETFTVTLGVNDQACAWIRIPVDALNKKMT